MYHSSIIARSIIVVQGMKTVVVVDDKISGDVTKSRHQRSSAIPELGEIRLPIPGVERA